MRLNKLNIKNAGGLLRVTFITGLVLLILSGGVFTFFFVQERINTRTVRQQESFSRVLSEYDLLFRTDAARDFVRLNRELDRLERMAIGVESWLSVLKRRRELARLHPPSMENYRKSVNSAVKEFPMSPPVAAIAAEALIKNSPINRDAENQLRQWLPHITDPSLNSLRLGLHVILGDFSSPGRAALIPPGVSSDGTEAISANLAVLNVLRADIRNAAAEIQTMLYSLPLSDDSLRLAAEFYFDFGDLHRSAEIFSRINDEKALARQADALYLAGYFDSARSIWNLLASSPQPNEQSLYNLALTATDRDEAQYYLERLVKNDVVSTSAGRQFGLIHYSRMLDINQAIPLLERTEGLSPRNYPYIDLEINKRQVQRWELGRQIAETWLLLDRHFDNEDMYKWASWLFLFQRNYSEMRILLNRMDMLQFSSGWIDIYKAALLMFEGQLERANTILRSIPEQSAEWPVYANLGRILEAERSFARAIEQYRLALEKSTNPRAAANIQLRIARCYVALGRLIDARHTLEDALAADPDNLYVRFELDRLSY